MERNVMHELRPLALFLAAFWIPVILIGLARLF
jgi:hypothetical protein